jgi:hypothetical protein
MARGDCDRCRRDYPLNSESRFQPTCPRCRRPLRVLPPEPVSSSVPLARRASEKQRWPSLAETLGVALPCVLLFWWAGWLQPAPPASPHPQPERAAKVRRAPPQSPFEETLMKARELHFHAQEAVREQLAVLQERSPRAVAESAVEVSRRDLLTHSPDIAPARAAARRAHMLARTRTETYRATYWLGRIECDAGHHLAELQQARKLMGLAPHEALSLILLQHAARCNGIDPLEQQAERTLGKLCDGHRRADPLAPQHGARGASRSLTWRCSPRASDSN